MWLFIWSWFKWGVLIECINRYVTRLRMDALYVSLLSLTLKLWNLIEIWLSLKGFYLMLFYRWRCQLCLNSIIALIFKSFLIMNLRIQIDRLFINLLISEPSLFAQPLLILFQQPCPKFRFESRWLNTCCRFLNLLTILMRQNTCVLNVRRVGRLAVWNYIHMLSHF